MHSFEAVARALGGVLTVNESPAKAEAAKAAPELGPTGMVNKRYWPFDLPTGYELAEEDRRDFGFLEAAHQEGHESYQLEGMVLGATAKSGREGEIVRRGGRGRYWEIILLDQSKETKSAYVDGFESAATAVLSWLRGDDCDVAIGQIQHAIVSKPGKRGW